MKASIAIVGLSVLLVGSSLPAFAETKTVIEEKDGKYKETFQDDEGTKSEYKVDKKEGTSVYKDTNGVSVKEKTEDGVLKQEYKDDDCEQATEKNLVTGETKVVAKGDCANAK